MDLQLVKKGIGFGRKKKKWVILLTALGFTGYGVYGVYNLPSVAQKRRKIFKLFGALVSVVEAVSNSAESVGIVSKDLKEFLQSDSDQIPNSLKQLSKIANSEEFSSSLTNLTQGLTVGLLRGFNSESSKNDGTDETFAERVMDRAFSPAGSGFASVIVGSFARNLVTGFYSAQNQANNSSNGELNPNWVNLIFSDKTRELIGDCVQVFVSTAVAVYLDKTADVNTYDELFSGLTNPKHDPKVRDMFVTVCNGAVETLVRTSHEVLTRPGPMIEIEGSDDGDCGPGGWAGRVSSTLAVPSNRRLVVDVTGRVTFETVRSFLEFAAERLYEVTKSCARTVRERCLCIFRYVAAKSSLVATICLSLCLHLTTGPSRLLMPA